MTISCLEIFSFQWKYRENRHLHTLYKTDHHTLSSWVTTNTRSLQKYPFFKVILDSFPINWLMTGSGDSEENLKKEKNR